MPFIRTLNYLREKFKTGAKPTESDFADVFESFWHKTAGKIPADRISGLDLISKYDDTELRTRVSTAEADIVFAEQEIIDLENAVGSRADLLTTVRTTIVAAINELWNKVLAIGGNLTTGRVAYVEGNAANTLPGRIGDPLRPYQTLAQAVAATAAFDAIVMRPGGAGTDTLGRRCYTEGATVGGSRFVDCLPGVVLTGNIDLGPYRGNAPVNMRWRGGVFADTGALNCMKQNNGPSTFELEGIHAEAGGLLKGFSDFTTATGADQIHVRRCTGFGGGLALTGQDNFGYQKQEMILTDCDFENISIRPSGSAPSPDLSKLILRGSTRIGGAITVVPTNSGAQLAQADVVIDQRSAGTSAPTSTQRPPFTNPVTDDVNKFFRATIPANYSATDAEFTKDSGATYTPATASMLSGGVVSVPVTGGVAAGVVGLRLMAGGGMTAGNTVYNPDPFTAPAANLVWDEDNAGIAYSANWGDSTNGTTQGFGSGLSHYGTKFKVAGAIGEKATFTVPAGYSKLSLQGHKDTGGSFFTLSKNGNVVYQDDMYAPDFRLEEYLRNLVGGQLSVAAGDVMVLTMTNSNFTTAAGSINVNIFLDQITFHP